jgi:hypothetical protein
MYSSLLFATLCFVFLLVHLKKRGKADAEKLPPGPPPIPILGNIRGIDTHRPWKTYAKWGEKYGVFLQDSDVRHWVLSRQVALSIHGFWAKRSSL